MTAKKKLKVERSDSITLRSGAKGPLMLSPSLVSHVLHHHDVHSVVSRYHKEAKLLWPDQTATVDKSAFDREVKGSKAFKALLDSGVLVAGPRRVRRHNEELKRVSDGPEIPLTLLPVESGEMNVDGTNLTMTVKDK